MLASISPNAARTVLSTPGATKPKTIRQSAGGSGNGTGGSIYKTFTGHLGNGLFGTAVRSTVVPSSTTTKATGKGGGVYRAGSATVAGSKAPANSSKPLRGTPARKTGASF